MKFDREVSFESSWLRLHRSPKAYMKFYEGTRTIQIFSDSKIVLKETFYISSSEWFFFRPISGSGTVIGDTLWIEAGTDIDSISVEWGDTIKVKNQLKKQGINYVQSYASFHAWKVEMNPKGSEQEYSLKLANSKVMQSEILGREQQ